MKTRLVICLMLFFGLILAACAPAATPAHIVTTQAVVETEAPAGPAQPEATEAPVESEAPAETELPAFTQEPSDTPEPAREPSLTDQLAAVDHLIEKLEFANLAFNAPTTINLSETALIQLLLSHKETEEALKQKIVAEGQKESARIRISNLMEARLSGLGFEIEAITSEIQAVSADQITEWRWEIRPTQPGEQQLHLTLSALIYLDDQSMPRTIRTFDQIIDVNVTLSQRISSFISDNWQWAVTVLLIPIAGWIIRKRRRSTK